MSLKDALGFEAFNVKDIWKGLKKDPKRIFLGVDPLSTKAWNAVLGRNDKPIVNQLGGPTKDRYQRANDAGIKTGTASTLHGIASVIAGGYGAAGAAGGLGNAAGSLGATGGTTGTAGATGAGGATGATGAGYGVAGGAAEAIPEVVVTGSTGSGLGTAGAGAGAGAATTANSNGNNWRDQLQQMPGQQDNSEQARAEEERRQLELLMEQERLRRESFRRNAIARAMG